MKRLLSIIVLSIVMSVLLTPFAYAATLRWSNVATLTPAITKTSNQYSCEILGVSGTSNISCELVLYEKSLWGNPVEVARTNGSSHSNRYMCIGEYSGFSSSKTYILEIEAAVTTNGYTENITHTYKA